MRFLFLLTVFFAAHCFSQQTDTVCAYTDVDVPAEFPGGSSALLKWIGENAVYPTEDADGSCSKIMVRFVVETNGRLTDITNARSCDPVFDRWSVALIAKMPNWEPALADGKPVRSTVHLPVWICFRD